MGPLPLIILLDGRISLLRISKSQPSLLLLCKTLKTRPVHAMHAWIHTLAAQSQTDTSRMHQTHSLIDWQRNVFSLRSQMFAFLLQCNKRDWLSWYGMCVKG